MGGGCLLVLEWEGSVGDLKEGCVWGGVDWGVHIVLYCVASDYVCDRCWRTRGRGQSLGAWTAIRVRGGCNSQDGLSCVCRNADKSTGNYL